MVELPPHGLLVKAMPPLWRYWPGTGSRVQFGRIFTNKVYVVTRFSK